MRYKQALIPYLFYLLLSVVAFTSCNKTLEEERNYDEKDNIETYITKKSWEYNLVGDVYHVVRIPSYGYQVAVGDTVTFWYAGYTLDGVVFDTNVKSVAKSNKLDTVIRSFEPLVTVAGRGVLIGGLDEGLLLVCDQEGATILFPSSLGFGKDAIGPIEQWSPLAYNVQITKVNGVGIQKEKLYLAELNPTGSGYTLDTSGLYYKFSMEGSGSIPVKTDTIYGWYKGTLPDGTVVKDLGEGNQQFVLSNINIPAGIRLGFMLTKVGGTTDLVLPSYLAYGNEGVKGVVEPYQTLFFQIRLDSIK
jgi:FKBP-type peptidyl-prolyl cis-trans isomerase